MTKVKKQAKALKAEQKKNYEEMVTLMKIENPDQKDINYLQGVMKGKKFNRDNRTDLTKILTEMEKALEAKVEETGNEPIAEGNPLTRVQMFKEIRDELTATQEKALGYSRSLTGGGASRLNFVSRQLIRLAKNSLKD